MKRVLLILALVAAGGACGGGDDDSPADAPDSSSSTATTAASTSSTFDQSVKLPNSTEADCKAYAEKQTRLNPQMAAWTFRMEGTTCVVTPG